MKAAGIPKAVHFQVVEERMRVVGIPKMVDWRKGHYCSLEKVGLPGLDERSRIVECGGGRGSPEQIGWPALALGFDVESKKESQFS